MKNSKLFIAIIACSVPFAVVNAEPYVSASLGWTFNQKLKSIKGDENLNYPLASSDADYDPNLFIAGSHYSNIKLKDVLQGGVKAGYYFESMPSLGLEVEANYSQPNMKRQDVTINIPDFGYMTEDQLSAKVQLLQFNLNGLYRYQGLKDLTPYIGGGPSINIIKITGTGWSGHIIDSDFAEPSPASWGPNVHDTSVNIGANFKVGAEYHLDKDWGLGAEYHYNWVPADISHFRSANNLSADMTMQSLSVVLTRHF